jgi:hypothetical protein
LPEATFVEGYGIAAAVFFAVHPYPNYVRQSGEGQK